jgi:two-component system, response regulator YesN
VFKDGHQKEVYMLNVILVDDEEWICKLISKIVNWNELGFNIVAEANDGETAIEMIREHKPDLVLTDIRMPDTDGLALIKRTRELQIKTEFIIISGYNDFEYARSALSYDSYAYLLKPLDSDELKEKLIGVREKIMREHISKKKNEQMNAVLLEKQIAGMISKTYIDEGEPAVEEFNKEYGLSLKEGMFQVALLQFDQVKAKPAGSSTKVSFENFEAEIKNILKSFCFEAIVYIKEKTNVIICVLNYPETVSDQIADKFNSILHDFKKNELYNNYYLTIGIGSRVDKITGLNDAYFSALNAVKARIKLGKEKVIHYSDHKVTLKNIFTIEDDKKVQFLIDIFDKGGFNSFINSLFKKYGASNADNPFIAFFLAYEIMDIIIGSMRKKDIYSGRDMINSFEFFQKFDYCSSEQEIIECLSKIFNQYVERYETSKNQNRGNRYINTVKSFISENYMKDINLAEAAKYVCLNPQYLSELFKKETGENFIDYLTTYRISVAKGYFKEVKYKVADVSEFVGYKDPKYFSKLFKKKVGVSPTEYISMYL